MYQQNAIAQMMSSPDRRTTAQTGKVERLGAMNEVEVLEFLSTRPIHTVAMMGFIRDNGIISPLHRGVFYAYRNQTGELEGVALIGHATLLETRSDRALEAFAEVAQEGTSAHMIMGEQQRVDEFWAYYSAAGQEYRLACRELLFELRCPVAVRKAVPDLRLATPADLELVMPVQAEMAFNESGINPMNRDPEGFRQRCVRRIELQRTWVLVQDGELIFKAEIMAGTPEATYLEGIWVNPNHRGTSQGQQCMSQLARNLLLNSNALCLLVNENNTLAQNFYSRAGYKLRSVYDSIFLK